MSTPIRIIDPMLAATALRKLADEITTEPGTHIVMLEHTVYDTLGHATLSIKYEFPKATK